MNTYALSRVVKTCGVLIVVMATLLQLRALLCAGEWGEMPFSMDFVIMQSMLATGVAVIGVVVWGMGEMLKPWKEEKKS